MKHLTLSRRAKASKVPGPPDVGRPLNECGLRDAPEMGRRLKKRDEIPDHIVSSHVSNSIALQELQGGRKAPFFWFFAPGICG